MLQLEYFLHSYSILNNKPPSVARASVSNMATTRVIIMMLVIILVRFADSSTVLFTIATDGAVKNTTGSKFHDNPRVMRSFSSLTSMVGGKSGRNHGTRSSGRSTKKTLVRRRHHATDGVDGFVGHIGFDNARVGSRRTASATAFHDDGHMVLDD